MKLYSKITLSNTLIFYLSWVSTYVACCSVLVPSPLSDNLGAGGTLECGALTPPWNYSSGYMTRTCEPSLLECCGSSHLIPKFAQYEGGIEPPHSKALHAFLWPPVVAGVESDSHECRRVDIAVSQHVLFCSPPTVLRPLISICSS